MRLRHNITRAHFPRFLQRSTMARPAESPPPEDTVFYKLFPARDEREGADEELDLACLAVKCSELAKRLSRDHVWHYQPFELGVCRHVTADAAHPPHLHGSLCYRDNVEDEWLVVWLLLEISKNFPHLVISVRDEDGEFLLIETAHHLPGWLRPETAQNRVFLSGGFLHVIPKPLTPAEITRYPVATPTLREAIELVSDPATPTEAARIVQEALHHRLSCFPAAIQTNLHRAHCYLPWPVGHMMSCDPSLVAMAVHALCDRGPEEMQAVRTMKHFSPSTHPSVMTLVTFTRCLYAKLLHLRFNPPPHAGFRLAPPTSHTHKAHELGMKLTCGLEMVVSGVREGGGEERGTLAHLCTGKLWDKFLKKLQENDYFQGEMEGSLKHQELMTSARHYFLSTVAADTRAEENLKDPVRAAGERAQQLMVSNPGSEEDMRKISKSLPPPDDDGWLEISPSELDAMMRRAAGYLPSRAGEGDGEKDEEREGERETSVKEMVHGVKAFVNTVSSHEGAEFPWRGDNGRVEIDVASVLQALRGEMEREGESDSGSEEEEEGMREMMEQMAQELKTAGFKSSLGPDGGEEEEIGLVKNLLSSLAAQPEAAGPASNILHSLGIPVPDPD